MTFVTSDDTAQEGVLDPRPGEAHVAGAGVRRGRRFLRWRFGPGRDSSARNPPLPCQPSV